MYLYETHCHTAEGSKCGHCKAIDLVALYAQKGYRGIIITDHFYNGNTAVNRKLPWREWVNGFCIGYELAAEEAKKYNLKVFFGWEYGYRGTEFLTYGLDKNWLLQHQELQDADPTRYAAMVREAGGVLVHAHPFRQRNPNGIIRLIPQLMDGVETVNKCNLPKENLLADQYAENFDLMKVGGTDFHKEEHIQKMGGMVLPIEVEDVRQLFSLIKDGQARIL